MLYFNSSPPTRSCAAVSCTLSSSVHSSSYKKNSSLKQRSSCASSPSSLAYEVLCIAPSLLLALFAGIAYLCDALYESVVTPFLPRSQHRGLSSGFHARFAEATGDTKIMKAQRHSVCWEEIACCYILGAVMFVGAVAFTLSTFAWDLSSLCLSAPVRKITAGRVQSHWQRDNSVLASPLKPSLSVGDSPVEPTDKTLLDRFPTGKNEYEARRQLRAMSDQCPSSFYFSPSH